MLVKPAIADLDTEWSHLPVAGEQFTIPLYIRATARRAGLPPAVEERLICIARYESGFKEKARNTTSSAGGVFQILDGTFLSTVAAMGNDWTLDDKLDARKNIEAAVFLYQKEGPWPWEVYWLGLCP